MKRGHSASMRRLAILLVLGAAMPLWAGASSMLASGKRGHSSL